MSPIKESPYLTVGTPDVNAVPAQFSGFVRQSVSTVPADINVESDMTDIRCEPPIAGNPALCQPNGPGPPAYKGETDIIVPIDVTDHCNYGGAPGPCPAPPVAGTVVPTILLHFTMPCAVPAVPNIGGECQVMTSWNAVYPGIVPPASPPANGSRMNIEVGQVRVEDGGLTARPPLRPRAETTTARSRSRACSRRRRLTEKQVERRGPVPAPFPALIRALVGR